MKKILIFSLNTAIIVLFIALPYIIFQGKLFVGGDDTRLQYVFPWEYLQHMAFFSWNNISSISYYNPNQFSLPLLLILSFLENVFHSKVIIDYTSFSAPLILGFIYMQLLIKEIFPDIEFEGKFLGSLFFVLSPILIQNQLAVFLTSVWLMGLIPLLGYYLLRYVKTGKLFFVSIAAVWSLILSIAMYTIPWILGFVLPIILGFSLTALFYPKKQIYIFVKRLIIFFVTILATQSFWFIPFFSTFIGGGNTIGAKVLSSDVANTFRSTVLSTAVGNTFYPLANLFHRQIIENFNWQTKGVFENFYDKIAFLNVSYIAIIITPLFTFKNKIISSVRLLYLLFSFTFLISLYLFTVNIGPFREIFLFGGHIPGFVMFRNFYDKFALGYVFLYAILISLAYQIIQQQYPKIRYALFIFIFFLLGLNALPIQAVVNSPLWTTQNSYRVITFPQEYTNFLNQTKSIVSQSSNILSIPMGIAAYTVIKEDHTNNVYAGTSPIKILTGINDFSGDLSFSPDESGNIGVLMKNKQYDQFNLVLKKYNTSFILVTENIPNEVKESYLFGGGVKLKDQDDAFIKNIVGEKILSSKNNNYELYKTKLSSGIFSLDKGQLFFQKVSPVHYVIHVTHVSSNALFVFRDSFHNGWNLFLKSPNISSCLKGINTNGKDVTECNENNPLFELDDFFFLWKQPIYNQTHKSIDNFGQSWKIDTQSIPKSSDFVKENSDGTIDFTIDLYFKPQLYFYMGSIVSFIAIILLFAFTIKDVYKK